MYCTGVVHGVGTHSKQSKQTNQKTRGAVRLKRGLDDIAYGIGAWIFMECVAMLTIWLGIPQGEERIKTLIMAIIFVHR